MDPFHPSVSTVHNKIIEIVQHSGLNYKIEQTPFTSCITLRKKFTNQQGPIAGFLFDASHEGINLHKLQEKVHVLEDENIKLQAEIILQAEYCRDQNKKLRQEAEIFKRKYIELKEVVIKKEIEEEEELQIKKREAKLGQSRQDDFGNELENNKQVKQMFRD